MSENHYNNHVCVLSWYVCTFFMFLLGFDNWSWTLRGQNTHAYVTICNEEWLCR